MVGYTKTTSTKDLYSLLHKLNVKNVMVCRKGELNKYLKNKLIKNYIINLDDYGSGTHWCALNTTKKLYFDSYAQPKPAAVPRDYKLASTVKELQSIESTDCGGLSCLWLYYINHSPGGNAEYYKLFKDVYR